jgi:dolichol kinase
VNGSSLRRLLHALSAALLLIVPLSSWKTFRIAVTGLAVAALLLDGLRVGVAAVGERLRRYVPVFRPVERRRPSGAAWLAAGLAVSAWFPPPAPLIAVLTGALADPAASFAGARLGRRQGAGKTAVGSGAFVLVAIGISVAAGVPWSRALVIAAVGMAVERWSGPIDDNLLVAPATAIAVWLLR